MDDQTKPQIDFFATYLALIKNSVRSKLFRNLFATINGKNEDILRDGDLSCAIYVTSILTLSRRLDRPHATADGTVRALKEKGWTSIPFEKVKKGDVLVWEKKVDEKHEEHGHVGFFVGYKKAVSTSSEKRAPVKHDVTFDGTRKIVEVLRCPDWS